MSMLAVSGAVLCHSMLLVTPDSPWDVSSPVFVPLCSRQTRFDTFSYSWPAFSFRLRPGSLLQFPFGVMRR